MKSSHATLHVLEYKCPNYTDYSSSKAQHMLLKNTICLKLIKNKNNMVKICISLYCKNVPVDNPEVNVCTQCLMAVQCVACHEVVEQSDPFISDGLCISCSGTNY